MAVAMLQSKRDLDENMQRLGERQAGTAQITALAVDRSSVCSRPRCSEPSSQVATIGVLHDNAQALWTLHETVMDVDDVGMTPQL